MHTYVRVETEGAYCVRQARALLLAANPYLHAHSMGTACALHVHVHCMRTACACALHVHVHCMCMCTACVCALHVYVHCMCMCTACVCALHVHCRLGYRIVYLQPRTDPRKGPLGANLFLRKDFSSEPPPPVE